VVFFTLMTFFHYPRPCLACKKDGTFLTFMAFLLQMKYCSITHFLIIAQLTGLLLDLSFDHNSQGGSHCLDMDLFKPIEWRFFIRRYAKQGLDKIKN